MTIGTSKNDKIFGCYKSGSMIGSRFGDWCVLLEGDKLVAVEVQEGIDMLSIKYMLPILNVVLPR